MNTNSVLLFTIQFVSVFAVLEKDVRLSGKRVACNEFNADYLNASCNIKLVSRYKQVYSASIIVKPGVSLSNLKVKMTSFYKFRTVFRPIGVKLEEDLCGFLNIFTSTLLLSQKNFKNLPDDVFRPCPISGVRKAENFELTYFRLPAIIPTGEYRFDSTTFTNIDGKEIFLLNFQNFLECSEIF